MSCAHKMNIKKLCIVFNPVILLSRFVNGCPGLMAMLFIFGLIFASCSSVNTGKERKIESDKGKVAQVQKRPFLFGIVPMCWTYWEKKRSKYEQIIDDIRGPVEVANEISLWASLILGAIAVSIQTPPINTISRRAAYASAIVYGGTVALLFIFGFVSAFWWLLAIASVLGLAYVLRDHGVDLKRFFRKKTKDYYKQY